MRRPCTPVERVTPSLIPLSNRRPVSSHNDIEVRMDDPCLVPPCPPTPRAPQPRNVTYIRSQVVKKTNVLNVIWRCRFQRLFDVIVDACASQLVLTVFCVQRYSQLFKRRLACVSVVVLQFSTLSVVSSVLCVLQARTSKTTKRHGRYVLPRLLI